MNRSLVRHSWLVCLVCAAAFAGRAAAAPASPTFDPWAGIGTVTAPGGPFLRDTYGRSLELHGADVAPKCGGGARPMVKAEGTPCVGPAIGSQAAFVLSPTAADPGRRFTAADARSLHDLGFTVVRLGIVWQGLEPGPRNAVPNDPRYCAPHPRGRPFPSLGAADPYRASAVKAYLARTDRIVNLLAAADLRVIIDMHQDVYGSAFSERRGPSPWNGEGAPPWATCTDDEAFDGRPYWGFGYGAPSVMTAIGHFWRNDVRGDLQGQFARVWRAVAQHYRTNPDILGYEVFNEPTDLSAAHFTRQVQCAYGGPEGSPGACAASGAQALRDGLIGAIESIDPTHLVFVEPIVGGSPSPSQALGVAAALRFPRLVFAVHLYGVPPTGVYGCPGHVCLRSERTELARFFTDRRRMRTQQPGGPPMMMDEFGGGPDIPDIAQVAALANAASLSWSYWSALQLHDPTGAPGENLLNDRTAKPWPAKARVLADPYPFATAGTPGPQRFDPKSRSFRFSYAVDAAITAPTEIVVPPDTYPLGYTVTVQGATVTSAPNASLLTLSPLPSISQVDVQVVPPAANVAPGSRP